MDAAQREQLRLRSERAFGQAPPDAVLSRVRAIVGSEAAMPATEEGRLAVEAFRKLKNGDAPEPRELSALQLLIRLTRPAPLVRNGLPDLLQKQGHVDVFPGWPAFRQAVTALRLVGRIDRASASLADAVSIGTGLLVADDLVLTNRHVVDDLSRGVDELQEGQAVVRFAFEFGSNAPDAPVPVVGVAGLHPALDLALLRVRFDAAAPAAPGVVFDADPVPPNREVVVIGYPLEDRTRNPLFIRNIFGTDFGVLRAAPGQCTAGYTNGFYHDCSTLGGNSGSPIFSMDGARVVGLHSGGGFLWKNTAVAAPAIQQFIADTP
jgi:S1-C subfamily serine protease